MPLTPDDLPDEWTTNYGGFITINDLVCATCKICYAVVFSDFFDGHTRRHAQLDGVRMKRRTTTVAVTENGEVL